MKTNVVRSLIALMAFAVMASAAYAGTTPEDAQEQALPEGQARVVIPVTGMTCGACCIKVDTAVKALDGVVAAEADYEEGRATVTYVEDKVTVEKIVETINEKTSFKASMPEETT